MTENTLSILPADLIQKAKKMSKAYEYLYCIENLLRDFIDKHPNRILLNFSSEVQKSIRVRKNEEQKHNWISLRGNSDLFYIDFKDLADVISNNWDYFKDNFPSQIWIKAKLEDLTKIRNLIAHNSYIDSDDLSLAKVHFNTIARQISGNKNICFVSQPTDNIVGNFFVEGLSKSKLWTYGQVSDGIEYLFYFPATIDVAPILLRAFYYQVSIAFYIVYENCKILLNPSFNTSREYEECKNLEFLNKNVQFQIGFHDIDKDGLEELFICAKDQTREFIKDGMVINVFKYYPPAFKRHSGRAENWDLVGDFKCWEEKAYVKESSITIPRNLRGFYYEWTFVKGEFRDTGYH
ncbi:hypothetical protein A4R26_05790 [Niastella populi]|uniref:Swt1-like HEPN domain-containing protein n=1 Tax=Niastella populi TaxID=550983 RepID=A0A1V9F5F8_9BACT|nr:hypothetical protein A4R26_05790 [Niastella populi]